MRLRRHSGKALRHRLIIFLLAGALVGMLGGLQIAGLIERAGVGGSFGGTQASPTEYRDEKPTEEDRSMGAALAAASARRVEDCRAFAPRHQSGCRAYFLERRSEAVLFESVPSPRAGNQVQPASFRPERSPPAPWSDTTD